MDAVPVPTTFSFFQSSGANPSIGSHVIPRVEHESKCKVDGYIGVVTGVCVSLSNKYISYPPSVQAVFRLTNKLVNNSLVNRFENPSPTRDGGSLTDAFSSHVLTCRSGARRLQTLDRGH
ncbi:hypothetical protein CBL_13654 [Carabus blaptoides fortunei]